MASLKSRIERAEERQWQESLATSLKGEKHFRDVVRIAEEERVVNLRNERRGHGWMAASEEHYRDDGEKLEITLSGIERELLPFFQAHRLVIPRDVHLKDGSYVVEGENLIGSHLLHPHFQVNLQLDPRGVGITSEHEVYLADNPFSTFKSMAPFICSAMCPECCHPRVLIVDGTKQ
jgi:hypothetical protein